MIHVETNIISMPMICALFQTIPCLVSSLLMICVVNYATRSQTWDDWKLQQSIEEISQLKTRKEFMSKVRNMFSALFAQLAFFTCWWHTSSRIGPIWCNLIEGDRFWRREGCGRSFPWDLKLVYNFSILCSLRTTPFRLFDMKSACASSSQPAKRHNPTEYIFFCSHKVDAYG